MKKFLLWIFSASSCFSYETFYFLGENKNDTKNVYFFQLNEEDWKDHVQIQENGKTYIIKNKVHVLGKKAAHCSKNDSMDSNNSHKHYLLLDNIYPLTQEDYFYLIQSSKNCPSTPSYVFAKRGEGRRRTVVCWNCNKRFTTNDPMGACPYCSMFNLDQGL
jgi:hypothetical protein